MGEKTATTHAARVATAKSRMSTRIASIRVHLGLSQTELGMKVGLDRYAISAIEDGTRHVRATDLMEICNVFHVSMDDMVGDQEPILLDAKVIRFDPEEFIPHAKTAR